MLPVMGKQGLRLSGNAGLQTTDKSRQHQDERTQCVRMSNEQKSANECKAKCSGCGSFFQAKAFPEWGDSQRRLCKVISLLCSQCESD